MGKSVIAFKVIITPRFHFEYVFIEACIGRRNKQRCRHFQDGRHQELAVHFITALAFERQGKTSRAVAI